MIHQRLLMSIIFSTALTSASSIQSQSVIVEPVVSTSPTAGNADDPAIWIHPTLPEKSIIIGTDKEAGIYVWDMNGIEIQHIPQGTATNNVDVKTGVLWGGALMDIVAANLRGAGKLAIFKVNPNYTNGDVLIQIADKNSSANDIQSDSYGFGLYRRPADNALFVFDRPKSSGVIRQYRVEDDGTGGARVTPIRDLNYYGSTAEGFVADDEMGFIYIAEEAKAIHKYYADPEQSSDPISSFGFDDGISGDREGIALYKCHTGEGYLVLSSQGNSTFKIYERGGDNRFVKTIEPKDHSGNGGLGTDGLDVISFAAPPNFPNGFLIAHDESGARYHIYDWAQIAENDLIICVDGGTPADRDTTPPAPPFNVTIRVED